MGQPFRPWVRLGLWLLSSLLAGCNALPGPKAARSPAPVAQARPAGEKEPQETKPIRQTALFVPAAAADKTDSPAPAVPFEAMAELSPEALVQQVLLRNPSLGQMVAAWKAASVRYPQVTSLDDPMFGFTVAPASTWADSVHFAGRAEISQKYPFPGKLHLRGENAEAEAHAAGQDVEDLRLQLAESARNAFADYYLVERALEVNDEALRLLKEARENAETRYRTGLVPQQDILQADVEIGRQRERQAELEQLRVVAVARINTLLHLPTGNPLPPPPKRIELAEALPEVQVLQAAAVAKRPDLQALADRIAADQAAVALAKKEFYPDFEVLAAYDSFWQTPQQALQPQVGVRLNLPVRKAKRCAAVAEAEARLAQRQAELDRQRDQVSLQVQEAHAQVRKGEKVVGLYTKEILPAAQDNVKAAQSAYITGKTPFLTYIEAERSLVTLRDRYYEAIADYFRRRAALERALGVPLGPAPKGAAAADPLSPTKSSGKQDIR